MTTDHIDMSTIDPTTIIVGPGGQTLAQAAAAEQADLYVTRRSPTHAVCTPNDADGPASPAVPSASEQLVRETIAALDAAIAAHGSGHDRVTRLDPTPEGWTPVVLEARGVESARRIATEAIAFSVAHSGVRRGDPEAWWDGSATRGRVRLLVPGDERLQLAEDLARRAGDDAEREHDESVASLPEGRHYTRCCDAAREDGERNEYAGAMEMPLEPLRRRHAAELQERTASTATIAQPDPAPASETMVVGVEGAKGMPPGLAEDGFAQFLVESGRLDVDTFRKLWSEYQDGEPVATDGTQIERLMPVTSRRQAAP